MTARSVVTGARGRGLFAPVFFRETDASQIVDDARDNRLLLERMLSLAGARVDCAPSGSEALRMAGEQPYDVVLMDIQMPEMDGIRTTESLRQDGFKNPVIALTAHAMPNERERCLSSGFDAFVVKPVRREVLIRAIAAALRATQA